MRISRFLYVALTSRLAQLREIGERDRGDSPVPTAVIILGLVVVAMAVTTAALVMANDWMDAVPAPQDPVDP